MPTYSQKCDCGGILGSRVALKLPLRATFPATTVEKWYPVVAWKPPWSRLGRDLAPKTLQGRIFIYLGSFLVDSGKVFDATYQNFAAVTT